MKDNRRNSIKALRAYCILLAFLISLPCAAAGENTTDSAAAETGDLVVSTVSTGEMPADADYTPFEQPPAPSPDTEEAPEPAHEIPSVETDSSQEEQPQDVTSHTEEAPEPAQEIPSEETGSSQEEQPQDVTSHTEEDPEPAHEIPSEETDSSQEEQPQDAASDSEEDPAEPAEDIPAGKIDDSQEEQSQDASPDTGEDPETTEEETSGEPGEAREDNVSWDGILEVDVLCKIQLRDVRLYRLTLPGRMDLILTVSGVPVKVTVVSMQSRLKRVLESAAGEPGNYIIHEAMTLEKGE